MNWQVSRRREALEIATWTTMLVAIALAAVYLEWERSWIVYLAVLSALGFAVLLTVLRRLRSRV